MNICFLTPSSDRRRESSFRELLIKNGIFACSGKYSAEYYPHGISDWIKYLITEPDIVIIDSAPDTELAEKYCAELKRKFRNIRCISVVDRDIAKCPKGKYVKGSDFETFLHPTEYFGVHIKPILMRYGYIPVYSFGALKLGGTRREAYLLNSPLALSESEYRILMFLAMHTDVPLTEDMILSFCFAESYRMVTSNVRVHISNINRKARAIGGRRLVSFVHNKGYMLNENM